MVGFPPVSREYLVVLSVQCFFALGALALFYCYARWRLPSVSGWRALFMVVLLGCQYQFLWVATNVFSEPLFLFLSLFAVFYLEWRLEQDECCSPIWAAVLFLLLFYTRTVGLALVPAMALMYWVKSQRSQAIQYLGWSVLGVAPWFLWSFFYAPTPSQVNDVLLVSYNHSYWLDVAVAFKNFGGAIGGVKHGVAGLWKRHTKIDPFRVKTAKIF